MSEQTGDSPSAEKLLNVLMSFADHGRQAALDKIRSHCGISRSTIYRYIQLLRKFGLVEESQRSGYYRLGPSVTRLAHAMSHERDFIGRTRPIMRDLAAETGESIMLSRRAGDRIVVLSFVDSDKMLRVNMAAANNLPIYRGSFGKLYIAFEPLEKRRDLISSIRTHTPPTEEEFAAIRQRGYATSHEEVEVGAASISVPIMSPTGDIFAVLTLAGPTARLTRNRIRKLAPKVFKAARSIIAIHLDDRET